MVTKHKISPRLDKEYKIKGEQLATPQLKKWFRQEVQKYRVLRENSDQQPTEQDLRDIFNGLPRFGKNSTASRYLVEEFAYDLEKIMHATESELGKVRTVNSLKARLVFALTTYCNEKDQEEARGKFNESMLVEVRLFAKQLLHRNNVEDEGGTLSTALLRQSAEKQR